MEGSTLFLTQISKEKYSKAKKFYLFNPLLAYYFSVFEVTSHPDLCNTVSKTDLQTSQCFTGWQKQKG